MDVATRNLEVRRCPSGRGRRARQSEEVAQERLALARQDGLRVELDALDGEMTMAQAHDLAVLSSRGDLEDGGETLVEHHQRVVARGIEVLLEPREHPAAIVMDAGGLAVHLLARARDGAPERLADGLVPETDAENRRGRVEASDQTERDARAVRIARPRGDDDALGLESLDVFDGDLVVPGHVHARAQLAHVLHEVVGERVVVVQHENHGFTGSGGERQLPLLPRAPPPDLAISPCFSLPDPGGSAGCRSSPGPPHQLLQSHRASPYRIRGGAPAAAPPPGPPTSSCNLTVLLLTGSGGERRLPLLPRAPPPARVVSPRFSLPWRRVLPRALL